MILFTIYRLVMPIVDSRDNSGKEAEVTEQEKRERTEITVREPIPTSNVDLITRINDILVYHNVTSLSVDYGILRFTHYPYNKVPTEGDELIDWYLEQQKKNDK